MPCERTGRRCTPPVLTAGCALGVLLASGLGDASGAERKAPALCLAGRAGTTVGPASADSMVRDGIPLVLGFATVYQRSDGLALVFEGTGGSASFDGPEILPPPFTTYQTTRSLDWWGISFSPRRVWLQGRWRLQAGPGAGLYFSRVTVHGSELRGVFPLIFSVPVERKDDESAFAPSVCLAADLLIGGGHYAAVEYQHLWLRHDFGALTPGEVQVGGHFLFLTLGRVFRE